MRRLSAIAALISTAAMFSISASSFAWHKVYHDNYKGENFKGEATEPMIPCPPEKCLQDGPYVGLGLGYDFYRVKQSTSINVPFGVPFNLNPSMYAQGWMGNIFAGYGQYFNWYYIAGELFASATSAENSNAVNLVGSHYNENFHVRGSYGVSILPGIKTSPSTLLYARLGYTRTSFNSAENVTNGVTTTHTSRTEWDNGLSYGMGAETALAYNFSVRGEYVHTQYDSFTTYINSRFKPSNNQIIVAVLYHFW